MTYEQNKRIINILCAMKARPGMYFGKHATYTALHTFLIGYANGIAATNADKTTELKWSDIADEVDAVLFNLITKCERKAFPPIPPEAAFFNVPQNKDKKRFDLFMEAFEEVLAKHPEYIDFEYAKVIDEEKSGIVERLYGIAANVPMTKEDIKEERLNKMRSQKRCQNNASGALNKDDISHHNFADRRDQ